MENVKYERTWCDYLTPCPYNKEVMVGSYECAEECEFCGAVTEAPFKPRKTKCDYGRYFEKTTGVVECCRPSINDKQE